ncbi:ArsR family transcriptional regulator [Haladaptatus pallidirubidus]|uniref:DUF7344 domain-containing protein n=1 Tax=Haladaptatus pallidirubidus TaxID=1008152 RepID=A0AAV3UMS1_9EURY|nr:ArsR family transcriptional regulator [Haladaptatus pallidirubidus]
MSPSDDEDLPCSLDELFDLIADPQRRRILIYLIDNADHPVPLEALLEELMSDESIDSAYSRERLLIRLRHIHLPKLADYGVIEYNTSLQLISYTEHPRVEALIHAEQIESDETGGDSNADDPHT